jgi:hypothetical protein
MTNLIRITTAIGFVTCQVLLVLKGTAVLAEITIATYLYGTLTGVAATFMALWWLRPPRKQ